MGRIRKKEKKKGLENKEKGVVKGSLKRRKRKLVAAGRESRVVRRGSQESVAGGLRSSSLLFRRVRSSKLPV